MRAARVEGVEGVDGPGGIVTRRPERDWGGDGGTAGFGRVRERMWFSKEGGRELQHFSCFLCCVYQTSLFGKFSDVFGYQNLVPDISSRFCERRSNVGRGMFSPSYGLD